MTRRVQEGSGGPGVSGRVRDGLGVREAPEGSRMVVVGPEGFKCYSRFDD